MPPLPAERASWMLAVYSVLAPNFAFTASMARERSARRRSSRKSGRERLVGGTRSWSVTPTIIGTPSGTLDHRTPRASSMVGESSQPSPSVAETLQEAVPHELTGLESPLKLTPSVKVLAA